MGLNIISLLPYTVVVTTTNFKTRVFKPSGLVAHTSYTGVSSPDLELKFKSLESEGFIVYKKSNNVFVADCINDTDFDPLPEPSTGTFYLVAPEILDLLPERKDLIAPHFSEQVPINLDCIIDQTFNAFALLKNG